MKLYEWSVDFMWSSSVLHRTWIRVMANRNWKGRKDREYKKEISRIWWLVIVGDRIGSKTQALCGNVRVRKAGGPLVWGESWIALHIFWYHKKELEAELKRERKNQCTLTHWRLTPLPLNVSKARSWPSSGRAYWTLLLASCGHMRGRSSVPTSAYKASHGDTHLPSSYSRSWGRRIAT